MTLNLCSSRLPFQVLELQVHTTMANFYAALRIKPKAWCVLDKLTELCPQPRVLALHKALVRLHVPASNKVRWFLASSAKTPAKLGVNEPQLAPQLMCLNPLQILALLTASHYLAFV